MNCAARILSAMLHRLREKEAEASFSLMNYAARIPFSNATPLT